MKIVRSLVLTVVSCTFLSTSSFPFSAKILEEKSAKISNEITHNQQAKPSLEKAIIKKIIIEGNNIVKSSIIRNSLPYQEGHIFDESLSATAINNIHSLGSFRQVQLDIEPLNKGELTLYVVVDEKKTLEKLTFVGNTKIATEKFEEKFNLKKLSTIDEETLRQLSIGMKKLYAEEHRHFVDIKTNLLVNKKNNHKASAEIIINEGPKSIVKLVHFKGNNRLSDRILRGSIFTRENWLLSFTDGAGTFNKEALEVDRHKIEYLYRDHGYLMAKVRKVETIFSENKRDVAVTFHIDEGKQFIVRNIYIPGDELFSEEELLPEITIKKNNPYAQTKLIKSMNRLRDMWGEKGYIYTNVYPQVKPDDATNEVDITFHVDKGTKLYANRITITGNKTTKDKVIRRQLDIDEGELITSSKLDISKASVEYLSYFERGGVNWNVHRIADELADLELNVREGKTGTLSVNCTYGSDQFSSEKSFRGMLQLEKRNFLGNGWDIGGMVEAKIKRIKKLEAHFFDPHLFDSDISGWFNVYKRWDEYDQWKNVKPTPIQRVVGFNSRFGFRLPMIDKRLQLIIDLGIEDIKNNNPKVSDPKYENHFGPIVKRTFQQGTLKWLGLDLTKDTRNHQVYPSSGYKLSLSSKIAPPGINNQFSFIKAEAQGSCYMSLIGKDSLVLATQLKIGHISSINGKTIPYKELFHMGGQGTVRGHVFGGIGPAWTTGDPLGAKNSALFNAELIFPLLEDYSMKGHFFYDTGAGWNTPTNGIKDIAKVQRNGFDLRHSVGFGINLVRPFPAKIDWGFKLDRKSGESSQEFHITMNYAW